MILAHNNLLITLVPETSLKLS